MKKFAVLGLVTLIAAPAALAAPGSSWLPEAQQLYKQVIQEKDPGARQANLFQGSAKSGETKNHQVQLTAGKYYSFFAACDLGCNNIDLTLKSADGSIIKADTEEDDAPMFGFRATHTGRYTLSVTIPGCQTAGSCKYSSQVFVGSRNIFND
ncbi:hypothetical protein A7P98_08390 [Eikenella sp. NML080894]|uniref:hypothetical protein n=1 Tax=Eikenella TaxID=538 RepID=UPI0007DEC120|nr:MULTISPECIES: hypothetical protein [Eikenella]OAM34951.1 hypothetical protein A7P98_08390 [Eikenella sp. NML080894]OAM37258.1 hypothetical protein A7P99_07275 [Eikenella sp. NML120348]OAM45417.1 hypothetical protein A7Q03_05830 [Eikenella sp. NML99-0057]